MRFRKLAILALVLAAWSQSGGGLYGQAFSVPISDKVVTVNLVFPSGESALVEARDGSMVTVSDDAAGYIYSFVFVLEGNKGGLKVAPFKVTSGGEEITYLTKPRPLNLKVPHKVTTEDGVFVLQAERIQNGSFPNLRPLSPGSDVPPDELRKLYGKNGEGEATCCVTCGSMTVCATRVTMWCGKCTTGGGSGGFLSQ